jgi:hypothetical protein
MGKPTLNTLGVRENEKNSPMGVGKKNSIVQ